MVDEKFIRHASDYPKHRFINGFYLFYIVDKEKIGKKLSEFRIEIESLREAFSNLYKLD